MSENKPVELVTCTIDGQQVSVPKGTLIIRAAESIGTAIPRFCDHRCLTRPVPAESALSRSPTLVTVVGSPSHSPPAPCRSLRGWSSRLRSAPRWLAKPEGHAGVPPH